MKTQQKPSWVKTMNDLATVFIQRIDNLVAGAKEIRLVFYTHTKVKSLKTNTRDDRKKTIKQVTSFFSCDTTNIE